MTKKTVLLSALMLLLCLIVKSQAVNDSTVVRKGKDKNVMVTKTVSAEVSEEVIKLTHEGNELARKGKYDKALDKLYAALKLDSNRVEILANIGAICNLSGNTAKAEEYLERAWTASDSSNFDIGVNLGLVYYNAGNYEESIELYSLIISKASEQMTLGAAYFNRSMAYARTGKCSLAQDDFDAVNKIYKSLKSAETELDRLKKLIAACNSR